MLKSPGSIFILLNIIVLFLREALVARETGLSVTLLVSKNNSPVQGSHRVASGITLSATVRPGAPTSK